MSIRKTPQVCGECGETFFRKERQQFCSYQCSALNREKNLSPEVRQAKSAKMKQHWVDHPEQHEKSSQALRDMALNNEEFRAKVKKRMTENNPGSNPEVAARAQVTKLERGVTYLHLNGGNGTGMTRAEKLLSEALDWSTQVSVPTHMPRGSGYPYHYKLDVANEALMIGVECDGQSHLSIERKKQDMKKEELLASLGWTILRFWNREIENDLNECVRIIEEAINRSTTSRPKPETTLPMVP